MFEFDQPRYIQSSFSLFFPEQRSIIARERQIYTRLQDNYFPAKLLTTQGEVDTDAPQLLFQSQHGHSQIAVAGQNVTLTVSYSHNWQTKPSDAHEYVLERSYLLFDILEALSDDDPMFCGSVTRVRIPSPESDEAVATFVARVFASERTSEAYHDVVVKTTTVIDDRFFSNVSIQNYRLWAINPPLPALFRLSRTAAEARGIEVVGDFNSRYAFNEDKPFKVTRQVASEILEKNLDIVSRTIERAKEGAT